MKINLGCGSRLHPAWINVDFTSTQPGVIAHDLRKKLPFEDCSADVIYHSHVLEHFQRQDAAKFLAECFRVLKKGGVLRVAVPDLAQIARSYLTNLELAEKGDIEAGQRYEWTVIELIDQIQRNHPGGEMVKYWQRQPMPAEEFVIGRVGSEARRFIEMLKDAPAVPRDVANPLRRVYRVGRKIFRRMGGFRKTLSEEQRIGKFRLSGEIHYWMYDAFSLKALLGQTGFSGISQVTAKTSMIPDFASYLLDTEPDGSIRKPDSLFIEALR